jgi:hypothetical protein
LGVLLDETILMVLRRKEERLAMASLALEE